MKGLRIWEFPKHGVPLQGFVRVMWGLYTENDLYFYIEFADTWTPKVCRIMAFKAIFKDFTYFGGLGIRGP